MNREGAKDAKVFLLVCADSSRKTKDQHRTKP